jgi:hypothetical protein
LFFARSAKKLDSLDFSLPCRAANDFPILACAANDFTVSHETNSLPGNKMCGVPKEVFTSKTLMLSYYLMQRATVLIFGSRQRLVCLEGQTIGPCYFTMTEINNSKMI